MTVGRLSVIQGFVDLLNNQNSETLIFVLTNLVGLKQDQLRCMVAKERGKQIKYLSFIVNVGIDNKETYVAKPGKRKCHWTLLFVDLAKNKWFYCDTSG